MVWTIQGLNPYREIELFLLQNVQTICGVQCASYSVDTGVLSRQIKRPGPVFDRSLLFGKSVLLVEKLKQKY